ncbi:MAG TPA: hypothetical protein VNL71_04580 [Chloroflexota bacterium]|nr:hypothetical protein [Chloroflexota bacterium]
MSRDYSLRPLPRKHTPIDGVCVDCGREVVAANVACVLRVDSRGRGRVVCNDCSARIHAAKGPAPITLQRRAHKDRGTEKAPDEG